MNGKAENVTGEPKRSLQPLWWGLVALALAVAIIGVAWYVYPKLQHQGAAIADLEKAQIATEKEVKGLPPPFNPQVMVTARERLREKAREFEHKTAANIAAVRKQALAASEDAFLRAKALVDAKMLAVDTRLAGLESSHAREARRVAELNTEIGKLRDQLNLQANEILAVRHELANRKEIVEHEIAQLKRNDESNHKGVESIEAVLATHRVEFEVTKHHSTEVVPGIYVEIDKANPSFSYVNGWMRVLPEDRTFWLRRQDVNEPFIFYGAKTDKHYELVLTGMRGTSVKGYLVLPEASPAPGTLAAAGE